MARDIREPIPVQPFLDWVERRARQLAVEYGAIGNGIDGLANVCDEIGWNYESGMRRLHRWRTGDLRRDGMVERAVIEDALWRTGVFFWEIYDDEQVAA